MKFVSANVPFISVGNRRVLTDQQLAADANLAAFVEGFPGSFERNESLQVWIYLE